MDEKSKIVVKQGDNDSVVLTVPFEPTIIIKRRGEFLNFVMFIQVPGEPLKEKVRHLSQKALLLFIVMSERARKGVMLTMSAQKMAEELQIRREHVYRHLTELRGIDLVRKVKKDVYQMNPSYVWWGSTADRSLAVSDWKQGVVRREVVETVKDKRIKTP